MATDQNKFKGLRLREEQIEGCLLAFGVQSLEIAPVSQKNDRYTGQLNGKEVFFTLFRTDRGITLGYSSGKDREVFDAVAEEIVNKCGLAGSHNVSLSIPNVQVEVFNQLDEYLTASGATPHSPDEINKLRTLKRWQGPRLDKIALAHYTTGTLTVQGINAHMAAMVMDGLRTLMPTADFLPIDLNAFEIPMTVAQAKTQTAARLPAAEGWITESIRKMLSSSIALCQTPQKLEDYCGVTAPALKALEGFIKQVYCTKGAIPSERISIGGWFEEKCGRWVLCTVPTMHVGPALAPILEEGYSMWHGQRHSLFHMAFDPEGSRLIETIEDARIIVDKVVDFIERSCVKIRS